MKATEQQEGLMFRIVRKASRIRYQWLYNRDDGEGKPGGHLRELSLYSVYMENINPEVVKMQAAVFEHLGLKLEQVMFSSAGTSHAARHRGHGDTMHRLIAEAPTEGVVIFDIDCIPLSRSVIENIYKPIIDSGALVGPIQIAGHALDRRPYAAPSALGISKELYQRLGRPSLQPNVNVDTAAILTRECGRRGIPVVMLPITHCVELKFPLWDLNKLEYGLGTTYADGIYHSFQISKKESEQMFLEKCRSVIGRA